MSTAKNLTTLNPELITPAYWSNIDIGNPGHFTDVFPTSPELRGSELKFAFTSLYRCLSNALAGDATDQAYFENTLFDPHDDRFADGSVFILETENLTFAPDKRIRKLLSIIMDDALEVGSVNGMNATLVDSWRQLVESRTNIFGVEAATETEKGLIYTKKLGWGVLVTQKSGAKSLAMWDFDDPRLDKSGELVMSRSSEGVHLPIEIGQTKAYGNNAVRTIERIKGLHIVYESLTSGGSRRKGKRSRLRSLAQSIVNNGVAQPSPVV